MPSKGKAVKEPFRRGLGYAIQWYDSLQTQIAQNIDEALESCERRCHEFISGTGSGMSTESMNAEPMSSIENNRGDDHDSVVHSRGQCSRVLQRLCPACFGGTHFGTSFDKWVSWF